MDNISIDASILTVNEVVRLLDLDNYTNNNKVDFINVRNTVLTYLLLFYNFTNRELIYLRLSHYTKDKIFYKESNFELNILMEIYLTLRNERLEYKTSYNKNFKNDSLFLTLWCKTLYPSTVAYAINYHGDKKGIDHAKIRVSTTSDYFKKNNIKSAKEYIMRSVDDEIL